jgi:hypothetical protein
MERIINRTMQVEDLERMSDIQVIMGDRIGVGYGNIHAEESLPMSDPEVSVAIMARVVDVDPKAPSCCIDGRPCIHTMAGGRTEPRVSVAGGAIDTALAAAELTGFFGEDHNLSLEERVTRIKDILEIAGLKSGGHVDKDAVDADFVHPKDAAKVRTGCGANDEFDAICEIAATDELIPTLTQALLGDKYKAGALQIIPAQRIKKSLAGWNPKVTLEAQASTDLSTVEVLDTQLTPTHGHDELLVVVNERENTTIDRDSFVAETDMQLFDIDMWYIDLLADAMARSAGPAAPEAYESLRHAMVAYQCATYLKLCDGTQRLARVK